MCVSVRCFAQADDGSQAKHALDAGQYATAEAIYRKLLRANPESPSLLTDLGISLSVQGRSGEAAEAFDHALRLRHEPKTLVLLAKAKCDGGDFAAVRPMLQEIAVEDRDRPDLLGVIAPCLLDAGDPVDAVVTFERLAGDAASVSDVVLVELTRAYVASAQLFFAKLNSASDKAPYVRAMQDAREGKAESARGAFPIAAEHQKLFRPDASYSEAISAWRSAPNDTALLYQLAVLSGEGSMRSYARCRELYPASPYADQLEAEMLASQGRRDEAIARYEQLLKTEPELPRLRQDLGLLYIQEQNWSAALAIFREQLAAHPADRQAAARISQSLLSLERYDDLKSFLLPRAAAPHPPLWLRLDLATAVQKLGDDNGAIAQLVAAEKDFPAEKSVHYRLIRLYAATGDSEASSREVLLFHSLK